jgi:hypothetical protein
MCCFAEGKKEKTKQNKNKQSTLSKNLIIRGVRSKTKGQEPYHYHQAILLDAQVNDTRQIKLRKESRVSPPQASSPLGIPLQITRIAGKKRKNNNNKNNKTDLLNTRTQRNDGSYHLTLTLPQTFEARQTKAGGVHTRLAVSRSLRTKALFLFYYTKGFGHNQKQF